MKKFNVEFDAEVLYVEITYEGMSEEVYQEYAYTYADDYEQVGYFIADRMKLFTENTDEELVKGLS